VLVETASNEAGFKPELSYGSHFFQDLVETGIFYVALFDGEPDVVFRPARVTDEPNVLASLVPNSEELLDVIHVARTDGLVVYSDIVSQRLLCQ